MSAKLAMLDSSNKHFCRNCGIICMLDAKIFFSLVRFHSLSPFVCWLFHDGFFLCVCMSSVGP